MPPTKDEIVVAVEALRAEAGLWESKAATLTTIADTITEQGLNGIEMGIFAPMQPCYQDLITTLASRCREGSTCMTEIGSTLHAVATTYETEEAANEHAFRNLY
jgi:hypothetical protein